MKLLSILYVYIIGKEMFFGKCNFYSYRSVGLSVCRSVGLSVCRSVGLLFVGPPKKGFDTFPFSSSNPTFRFTIQGRRKDIFILQTATPPPPPKKNKKKIMFLIKNHSFLGKAKGPKKSGT